jgi:glucan phosphoethanolaminetransferase (alkaline phosphatase superfamily)
MKSNRIHPSYSYFFIVLLLSLLLIPNTYLAFHGSDFSSASLIKKGLFLLLSFTLLAFPLLLLRPKVYLSVGILFVLMGPFELACIYLYKSPINAGIVMAVFNTNFAEATELLQGILPLTLFGVLCIVLYTFLLFRFVKYSFRLEKKVKMVLGGLFLCTIIGMWLRDIRISASIHSSVTRHEIFNEGTGNFINKFGKIFPYNTIIQVQRAIENRGRIDKYKENVSKFTFCALKKDTLHLREKYILIIGETSRSHNWQLYGYQRKTNPELLKLSRLTVLSDFTSTANLTSISLPLILSRATPDSFDVSYREKTIVWAFKECGFKTYWISNQGIFNSELARFTLGVDKVYDLNSGIDFSGNYDEKIFPYLDSVLNRNDEKQFIIIHLMGSHFRYNFRYPEKFNVFKPGIDGAFDYMMIRPENREKLVNIYDNSILYSDHVLSVIFDKIGATKTVSAAMFLSDHGENLFDDQRNLFGHGTEIPTQYEVKIPCILFISDKYDSIYPGKVANLKSNKGKRISTSNVFYSFLDAANIGYKEEKPGMSFFNKNFREDSIRKVINPGMKVTEYDRK